MNMRRATLDSVGDWGGEEREAVDLWNQSIDELFTLIDYHHIGSGIVHTQYHTNPEFAAYQEEAEQAINSWLSHDAWELFCGDNVYGIGE